MVDVVNTMRMNTFTHAMMGDSERVSAARKPMYGTSMMKHGARMSTWSEYLKGDDGEGQHFQLCSIIASFLGYSGTHFVKMAVRKAARSPTMRPPMETTKKEAVPGSHV